MGPLLQLPVSDRVRIIESPICLLVRDQHYDLVAFCMTRGRLKGQGELLVAEIRQFCLQFLAHTVP